MARSHVLGVLGVRAVESSGNKGLRRRSADVSFAIASVLPGTEVCLLSGECWPSGLCFPLWGGDSDLPMHIFEGQASEEKALCRLRCDVWVVLVIIYPLRSVLSSPSSHPGLVGSRS